jgi:hypothetical protein
MSSAVSIDIFHEDQDYLDEKLNFIKSIIEKSRSDIHAQRTPDERKKSGWGYRPVQGAISDEMIRRHLSGTENSLGVYVMRANTTTTKIAILDLDDHSKKLPWLRMQELAKPVIGAMAAKGFSPWVVRSGSGYGIHIWLTWEADQGAEAVKSCLAGIIESCGYSEGSADISAGQIDIFPGCTAPIADDEGKPAGDVIALPFGRQSVQLDPQTLEPCAPYPCPDKNPWPIPKAKQTDSLVIPRGKEEDEEPDTADINVEEVKKALACLSPDCPYDSWLRVGMALRHEFGGGMEGVGFELWRDWSRQKTAGTKRATEIELRQKWKSFVEKRTGKRPITIASLFEFAKTNGYVPPRTEAQQLIEEFNKKYFVCTNAGRTRIYPRLCGNNGERQPIIGQTPDDFRFQWMTRRIKVGTNRNGTPVFKNAADIWLNSPERAQFDGFVFDPTGTEHHGKLNLWTGFAVQSRAGSWEKLRNHIRDIVCAGDEPSFQYMMNYLARLVQFPAERGHVSIVMRSDEGTGKGVFVEAVMHLFGRHAHQITNPKHLVGNFNAHLRDCVVLFADEAFFAGDKAHIGALKGLITERTIPIEGKFENLVEVPNYLHIFMASNNRWVVPAGMQARRFFVLDVLETHQWDHAYFLGIIDELKSGGYEAMLNELRNRDISAFNPRAIPKTNALNDQKLLSLNTEQHWLLDVLQRGRWRDAEVDVQSSEYDHWPENFVTTDWIYRSYTEFAAKAGERHPLSRVHLGRLIGKLAEPQRESTGNRKPGYRFGTLGKARANFCEMIQIPIPWEEIEYPF